MFDLDLLVVILIYILRGRETMRETERELPSFAGSPLQTSAMTGVAWNAIQVSQERLDLTETALLDWTVAAGAQLPASSSLLLGSASTESWNQEPELGTEPSLPAAARGLLNC